MAAENTSNALTKMIDITECSICLKTFTDPRMLPCIHTFCFHCLQDVVDKTDKKPGDWIQCPVCRKEFTVPVDGIEVVQKNFFMTSIIEVRNALNQSQIQTPLCGICKENSKISAAEISEATVRCLVCMENLCGSCLQQHNTFRLMRNHEILNIGNYVQTEDKVEGFKEVSCDIHRGKLLDYYCAECKKVVCVGLSCFVESHKTHDCKDVNSVENGFREILTSKAKIMSSLSEELLSQRRNCVGKKGEFLKKLVESEQEVLQRSEELKKLIDEHTQSLLSSLHEIKRRHMKGMQIEEDELDRRLTILDSFSRYCDELGRKGSAKDVCQSKDELLQRADELEEDHEAYIMQSSVSFDVTFQATDAENIFEAINGNIVGSIKETIEQLENFAVATGGTEDSMHLYKIKIRDQIEMDSPVQALSTYATGSHAAAVYDHNLFLVGVGILFSEIWKYSFISGWKKVGYLIQTRQFHCVEFIGETLYICGGREVNIVLDSIEAYNALTEKTKMAGQLIVGSEMSACVSYKDLIYVFGGADKDKKSLDCVQMFNPVGNTCTLLSTSMPRPAGWLRAVLWKTYAIIQSDKECFVFDFDGEFWQERQQFIPDAELYLFGMVLENERIFIIGGALNEVDMHGNEQIKCLPDVKYVRASSIVNNEVTKWKTYGQLPKPIAVVAAAMLPLSN